jgi:hypothetical protein
LAHKPAGNFEPKLKRICATAFHPEDILARAEIFPAVTQKRAAALTSQSGPVWPLVEG